MFRDGKLYRWLTLSPRQGGTSVFESFAGVWSKKIRDCFDELLVRRYTIQLLRQRWICSNTPGMLHYPPPDPGGFDGEQSESCQQVQHFKLHPHNLVVYSVVYNIERDISQNRRMTYTAMFQFGRRVIGHFSPVINNKEMTSYLLSENISRVIYVITSNVAWQSYICLYFFGSSRADPLKASACPSIFFWILIRSFRNVVGLSHGSCFI